jgi:hypothetical protein
LHCCWLKCGVDERGGGDASFVRVEESAGDEGSNGESCLFGCLGWEVARKAEWDGEFT